MAGPQTWMAISAKLGRKFTIITYPLLRGCVLPPGWKPIAAWSSLQSRAHNAGLKVICCRDVEIKEEVSH